MPSSKNQSFFAPQRSSFYPVSGIWKGLSGQPSEDRPAGTVDANARVFDVNFSPFSRAKPNPQQTTAGTKTTLPYQNMRGLWVSGNMGRPHTGPITQNGLVTGYSHKGYVGSTPEEARLEWQRAQLDPESPDRFVGREVARSPELAERTGQAYEAYDRQRGATNDAFNRWFKEFQSVAPAARRGLDRALESFDTTALESELRDVEAGRRRDFEDVNRRYTEADQAYENEALAAIRDAERLAADYQNKTLPKIGNFALSRAYNEVARRYGVPNEGRRSSDLDSALASAAYRTGLQIEDQAYQNNMDVLRNLRVPLQGQIRANEASRIAGFEYPGRNNLSDSQAQMLYNLQQIRTQLAGRPLDEVARYMQFYGLPPQYAQELMSGDLSNLAAIASLDESAYYRGLEDRMGIDQVTPTEFVGGYPALPPAQSSVPDLPVAYAEDLYPAAVGAGSVAPERNPLAGRPIKGVNGETLSTSEWIDRWRSRARPAPPSEITYPENPYHRGLSGYYQMGDTSGYYEY